MNYARPRPFRFMRPDLLVLVVLAHLALIASLIHSRPTPPGIVSTPMIADLLSPGAAEHPRPRENTSREAARQPAAPPRPRNTTPVPAPQPAPAEAAALPAPGAQAPAEEGSRVSQARFDADYLRNPPPPYPALSRRMGEEGKVILRVSVTPQGTAETVEIRNSSGSARLDEAAARTVRTWRFVPAKRGDSAIQSWVIVPIAFKLEQ